MNFSIFSAVSHLRWSGLIEGTSYLLLLFIAMPLKYGLGMPLAVKLTGWLHGIFFIWYWIAAVPLFTVLRWPIERSIGLGLASILPFGIFVMERFWLQPLLRNADR